MGRNLAKARERKIWRILALQRPHKKAYTIARLDATECQMGHTVAVGLTTARSEASDMWLFFLAVLSGGIIFGMVLGVIICDGLEERKK